MIDSTDRNEDLTSKDKRIDILSLFTRKEGEYLQNYEALAKLKEEVFTLYNSYVAIAGFSLTSLIFSPLAPIGFATLLSAAASLEYFRVIARLHDTIKMLLETFGKDGIVITPRVRTNSAIIDLLVRTPDKRMFALMIRSSEGNSAIWRETYQRFYITRKGKNAKKSDPLTRAMDDLQTIVDLKKEKHPLMGITSVERNVPLIKAIVLAPGAKIAASNSPEMQTEFGEAKVLKIKTTSITYIVEYDELVKFLLPQTK